ncbi:MAG: hypothetical protein WCD31_04495 [Gillisia sp.]
MKTLSRKELVARSVAYFKERTEATLFATSDGQFFVFKDRANMHATSTKAPMTVYEIERKEVEEELAGSTEGDDDGYTVKELKALVAETSDKAVLEGYLEDEKKGENRKTAIAAIEDRLEELNDKTDE